MALLSLISRTGLQVLRPTGRMCRSGYWEGTGRVLGEYLESTERVLGGNWEGTGRVHSHSRGSSLVMLAGETWFCLVPKPKLNLV